MKTILTIYTQWRSLTLTIILATTCILALCEAETLTTLLLSKAAALTTGIVGYRLYRYWDNQRRIDNIRKLLNL